MFAFHYFLKSSETWSSILRTLKDAVKVGGYFFATFFDAAKIEKLVVGDNKPWICRGGSSGEPVLSLTRDRSKENKDDVFGKKLIVFAETIGQHPEFLLDRDWLVKEMKSHGFELCNHDMRTWSSSVEFERGVRAWSSRISLFSFTYAEVSLVSLIQPITCHSIVSPTYNNTTPTL